MTFQEWFEECQQSYARFALDNIKTLLKEAFEAGQDSENENIKLAREIRQLVSKLTPEQKAENVGTHNGKRLNERGKCEKCGTPTNWAVRAMGRAPAYWCGC